MRGSSHAVAGSTEGSTEGKNTEERKVGKKEIEKFALGCYFIPKE